MLSLASGALPRWAPWIAAASLAMACIYMLWLRFAPRIYCRERYFHMDRPFALGGRPDLVMQEWGGGLVVHDLKTRKQARVYPSDRLQLALYATLLRSATGRKVASHAVVRVATPGGGLSLLRVDVQVDAGELAALQRAFLAACASPPGAARMTASPSLCRRCGFNGRGCSGKAPPVR